MYRYDSEKELTKLEYKTKKRREIIEEGYRIWGNMGDQWSDLLGENPGNRTFKLPMPMFYSAWPIKLKYCNNGALFVSPSIIISVVVNFHMWWWQWQWQLSYVVFFININKMFGLDQTGLVVDTLKCMGLLSCFVNSGLYSV